MKFKYIVAIGTGLISNFANAANVGVVDSGTWFLHKYFTGKTWINTKDFPDNERDDDYNGKIDDVHGWNFAAGNAKVFNPEHLAAVHPNVYKIFGIIAKIELGTITIEENQWWQDNVKTLPQAQREKVIAHLNWYGQYAHSTHTSGIVVQQNPNAKIMSTRIFPDSAPSAYSYIAPEVKNILLNNSREGIVHYAAAYASNQVFNSAAAYLKETKMDIANYSIGVPMSNLAKLYWTPWKTDPTFEEIKQEAWNFYAAFEPIGKAWIASAPNTLFVIAAANDGMDNEIMPIFPANVQAENAITVTATQGRSKLASFSNWGAHTVHVAAPGVAIQSSVPGTPTKVLPMSGTSMAAPYVTGLASKIKDTNPRLKPAEIRKILMETVDKKPWLEGKVTTSGIVNDERAVKAAALSITHNLSDAITTAIKTMGDLPETLSTSLLESVQPDQDMLEFASKIRM